MATPIRARHQHVAKVVSEAFSVEMEDGLNAIRRHYAELSGLFSGEGPPQLFALYQCRTGRGGTPAEVSKESARGARRSDLRSGGAQASASAPIPELFFTHGDALSSEKGVFLLRTGEGPIDLDRVRRQAGIVGGAGWRGRGGRGAFHSGGSEVEGANKAARRPIALRVHGARM